MSYSLQLELRHWNVAIISLSRIEISAIIMIISYSLLIVDTFAWLSMFGILTAYSLLIAALLGQQITFNSFMGYGSLLYGFHLYPMALLVLHYGTWQGWLFILFLWFYLAAIAAIFLFGLQCLLGLIRYGWRIMLALVGVGLYIFSFDQYILAPFGAIQGYGAFHPLVVFMEYRIFRVLLWALGNHLTTFLFLMASAFFLVNNKSKLLIGSLACILLLGSTWSRKEQLIPSWVKSVKATQISKANKEPWDVAHQVYQRVAQVVKDNPEVELIIFPESTCPFELNRYDHIIWFLHEYLGDRVEIILGGHRRDDRLYNSFYGMGKNNRFIYDKIQLLLGAERIPWNLMERTLITNGQVLSSGQIKQEMFVWKGMRFQPLICSELFFASYMPTEKRIICIAQDAWYKGSFLPKLLSLTAMFKAASWQKEMVYVAYEYAWYLGPKMFIDIKA